MEEKQNKNSKLIIFNVCQIVNLKEIVLRK